jgi:hypothetical protein
VANEPLCLIVLRYLAAALAQRAFEARSRP